MEMRRWGEREISQERDRERDREEVRDFEGHEEMGREVMGWK